MADVADQGLNQSIGDTPNVGSNTQSPAAKKDKKKTASSKPSHPPTSQMVNGAIAKLKERGGSSLQAIKKYISANYKVDAEKMAPFIKKYLRSAVVSGALIQTKGKGASGSFKLASASLNKPTKSAAANVNEKKTTKAKPKKKTAAKAKTAASKAKPAAKKTSAKKTKRTAASSVAPSTSATEKPAEKTEIVGKRGGGRASATKTAAVAAIKKTKSSPKAKKPIKTASSPVKKPKSTKAAAASPKAKKAASPKKRK